MDERKGFLTTEQEKLLDEVAELTGLYEKLDGVVIKLVDNYGLEVLKKKIDPEVLPTVYEVIDSIMGVLGEILQPKPEN